MTPVHRQPRLLALVALGGTLGTAARLGVASWVPATGGLPVGILLANLTGAFLLGHLLERLTRSGPDQGRRRDARLLFGTGILGGYTTYSSLALGTAELGTSGLPVLAVAYGLGSVLLGVPAAWAGIVTGRWGR